MSPSQDRDHAELDNVIAAHPQLFQATIPLALRASVERHQSNLMNLVRSLRHAGVEPREVEAAVATIIDSYRCKLLDAMRTLAAGDRPAEEPQEDA